uniref:T-complex protein 1 subunit gamma n=1 Tax=Compsopogon caeruleus TaxID=31354 RepID=A0A7S1TE70_9RHOD|mmetsp:Transcript_2386/g.4127  ORF Transcript_2386/g.4127 Transcript_2386/m.4127 type:complete len:547 (+) Transcript_2386:136-1776(+)|eukprot:CAMPEP_0184685652 /NCGR_PEP_ID=MMETSP0312-20130426/19663_1 /TAXON_ID=31354 /ORGANISM="Compsopogon coeruleus, Strain SAG 36.94" /LENGTH=546 /DNA_ID=CAMNT_0027139933 /DNA_START=38 /DNA_END=1678 /DNA_ORIENTATION=-
MQAPVLVLNANAKRESGRRAQLTNIAAAKAVSDIIRTTLGPRAMLKMILSAGGSIMLTNDGNSILREVDVSHPSAKSMIELSKTQDEQVGDGTTSVVVLAGEMLTLAEDFLQKNIHPTVIVSGYFRALRDAVAAAESLATLVDVSASEEVEKVIKSCIGTKFVNRYKDLMVSIALQAVRTVSVETNGRLTIDFKNYARVEKVVGGEISDSRVLDGVMFNKDVVSGNMRRRIENPRIVLLDCPLEYKKGESQTNVELSKEEDWQRLLEIEEEEVKKMCDEIIALKPDLVITEKGISDLALHFLGKHNISAIRRLRKTDNNRIARATGATIVSRTEELKESDVGTGAGLFEVTKIGDEYYSYIVQCKNPKSCTIVLRGGSKDVLNEVERNLQDAMCVARNVLLNPKLVPGGGATEMAVASILNAKAKAIEGVAQWPYRAVAQALEVIPRTLAENCGASVVRVMTQLRAMHSGGDNTTWGIDGNRGVPVDMRDLGVWDPLAVKVQTMKTGVEAAALLLRIDDIVSGISKKKNQQSHQSSMGDDDDGGFD